MTKVDSFVGTPFEREATIGYPHSIAAGAVKLAASQIARWGFRLGFVLIAARILGPRDFGLYAVMISIQEIIAKVSGAGFTEYLTREVAKSPESGARLWLKLTTLRCVYLAVLISLTLGVLLGVGYGGRLLLLGAFFGLTLFPRTLIESTQGVLRGHQRLGLFLVLDIIQGALLFGSGVVLLLQGKGLAGAIWAELAAALCAASCALWALPRSPHDVADPAVSWWKTIQSTFVFNLWPILVNLYDRFDVILLSRLVGEGVAGIYAIPYRAFGSLQILPYGIMGSSLPKLAAGVWDERRQEEFHRLLGWLFGLAVFSVLATMLFADWAVRLFLGPAYRDSALAMKILIWAIVPAFLNNALNTLLLARNRERVLMQTAGVCLIGNLATNLLLIPRYSFVAAAGVTILTELLLLAQNAFATRPLLGAWGWPNGWGRTCLAFGAVFGGVLLVEGKGIVSQISVSLAGVALFGCLLLWIDVLPTRGIRTSFEGIWVNGRGSVSEFFKTWSFRRGD